MEDLRYKVTYADGGTAIVDDLKGLCLNPTDPRDEIVDCRICYPDTAADNKENEL